MAERDSRPNQKGDPRRGGRGDRRGDGRDDRRGNFRRDDRRDDRGGSGRRDDRRDGRRDGQRGGFKRDDRKPRRDNKPHTKAYRSDDPSEPMIPAGVTIEDLDPEALESLSTLSGANREIVGRHLVAAGQMLDVDPEVAYQHAQAAVRRAGRVDVVREAAALTAYATGRYEEALREVRAVRRMRGDESLRAIEADSERGLGRPERAVTVVEAADLKKIPLEDQVELVLVSAGARADLEQYDVALLVLEEALHKLSAKADPNAVGRLQSFRADVLRMLGREEDAAAAEALIPPVPEEIQIIDIDEILEADVDHTSTSLRGSREALVDRYDALVLDMDGVCFEGTDPIAHASESITKAKDSGLGLAYATNNASRTPKEAAEKLHSFGIPAEPEHIMNSAMDLMYLLRESLEPGAKVLVVGTSALEEEVRKAGFEPVREAVEGVAAVAQGFGPDVNWAQMSEAAYAIANGARFYATNMDASLPTERGFALGNGALVAAVSRATKRRPEAAGKPEPGIFLRAAELVGAETPLAVGDRLETDIAGAVAARIPSIHVLTGVSSARDVVRAQRGQRPTYLARDLRGLFEAHPQPKHHRDGTWTAGVSQPVSLTKWGNPVFHDIQLRDDGDPVVISIDNYRALAAAAWEQLDDDKPLRIPELIVVSNDDPNGTITESNYQHPDEESASAESTSEEAAPKKIAPEDTVTEDVVTEGDASEDVVTEDVVTEDVITEDAGVEDVATADVVLEDKVPTDDTSEVEIEADGE